MIKKDAIKIEMDNYPDDNTLCIVLFKKGFFDLFWIDNPINPEYLKNAAKQIETSVNNMTDEFVSSINMIRTGGDDKRLDIAYELCDFLSRNQKLDDRILF